MRPAGVLLLAALGLAARAGPAPAASARVGASVEVKRRTPERWGRLDFDPSRFFEPEEMAAWSRFRNLNRALSLVGLGVLFFLYLVLLRTRLSDWLLARAQAAARRLGSIVPDGSALSRSSRFLARAFGEDWAEALLYTLFLMLFLDLAFLPLDVTAELVAQAEGLSNYTALTWLADLGKSLLLAAFGYTSLVFGLFGLVRRFPRRWWWILGGPAALLLVAYGVVSPYRARLYYDFEPLPDTSLKRRIEAMAEREGVPLHAVKVRRESRTSKVLNAYIAGVGAGRELVLYDTLLEALDEDQILAAVAHELAHERQHDVVRDALLSAGGLLLLLFLVATVLRRFGRGFGHAGPGDVRNLPLMLLTLSLAFTVARPVVNAHSRARELEADRIALTMTGDPEAFVSLQVALARRNKADVVKPWWVEWWFSTHPSVYERIGTALWYEAWLRERGYPVPAPAPGRTRAGDQTGGSAAGGTTPRPSKR
ncbi:MAG: hypothetical protein D6729_01805 [Deltaproteobacteria bacterium]|nr:MAG: hypothetical protein D6729_01805 [Deltaproteobacteria bacterium]